MALKACRECGHKVSLEAKTCPNCGAKKPGWGRFVYAFPGLFALLIVGSCAVAAFSQETDIYYAEIKQWVVEPCAEVGAALAVKTIEETDMTVLRKMTAQELVRQQEPLARELARKMRSGAAWEDRRKAYPMLLRMCIERMSSWPK